MDVMLFAAMSVIGTVALADAWRPSRRTDGAWERIQADTRACRTAWMSRAIYWLTISRAVR